MIVRLGMSNSFVHVTQRFPVNGEPILDDDLGLSFGEAVAFEGVTRVSESHAVEFPQGLESVLGNRAKRQKFLIVVGSNLQIRQNHRETSIYTPNI